MKNLTPIKACRDYCFWCCRDIRLEVKLCSAYACPLYSVRMGKILGLQALISLNPDIDEEDRRRIKFLSPVKAIKVKCWECSTFSIKKVKNCSHTDCQLYSYRLGKNPARKGIGGNPNFNKKNDYSGVHLKNNDRRTG